MSLKIDEFGNYRAYHGYSVISMVKYNQELKFLEDFLQNSKFLKKYFSPLPSSVYHFTIYDIWRYADKLLPVHEAHLLEAYKYDYIMSLKRDIKNGVYKDKDSFIANLLTDIDYRIINYNWLDLITQNVELIVNNKICLKLEFNEKKMESISKIREGCESFCGRKDNLKFLHLTLAYSYKNIDCENVDYNQILSELEELKKIVPKQIEFQRPSCYYFNSMTSYQKVN